MVIFASIFVPLAIAYVVVRRVTAPLLIAALALIAVPCIYIVLTGDRIHQDRDYILEGWLFMILPYAAGSIFLLAGIVVAVVYEERRGANLLFAAILAVPYGFPLVEFVQAEYFPPTLYNLRVVNRTGQECEQVSIDFGTRKVLFQNEWEKNGRFPDPAPTEATVHWTTKDGTRHTQAVALKSLRGKELHGVTYYFVLRYDGVVEAAPWTYREGAVKQGSSGKPMYCTGIKNLTKGRLADVAVRFGRYQVDDRKYVDVRGVGNDFVFTFALPYPITETAVVQWTTVDGIVHKDETQLRRLVPEDSSGICICFLLGENPPVQVRAVPFDDLRAGKYPELSPKWPSP